MVDMVNQVKRLESTQLFKDWKADNPQHYLSYIFYMTDDFPQVGYYDPDTDKITTFIMGSEIETSPEQAVFKKEGQVKPLKIDEVQIPLIKALEKARALQEEEYKAEEITKEIIVLQNIEQGLVYNVTLVTASFKLINIKLCANSGTVLEHNVSSVMDLGEQVQ